MLHLDTWALCLAVYGVACWLSRERYRLLIEFPKVPLRLRVVPSCSISASCRRPDCRVKWAPHILTYSKHAAVQVQAPAAPIPSFPGVHRTKYETIAWGFRVLLGIMGMANRL